MNPQPKKEDEDQYKITIQIDKHQAELVASCFPDRDKDKTIVAIAELAFSEWADWFAAKLRPKSISALSQERVNMIYEDERLYSGKYVKRAILFNQFNLPYGESAYIERVFSEKQQPYLRKLSLNKIIADLDTQLTKFEEQPEKLPNQQFAIEVDKYGRQTLQAIFEKIYEIGKEINPKETTRSVDGRSSWTFTYEKAKLVINIAKDMNEGIKG